jgi:hypothetical protein
MKKAVLLLIFLIFLNGCSGPTLEVKGEVREPRLFNYNEMLSLENSSSIIFWHVLAASGCVTGRAYDILVYGSSVKDIRLSNAYKDDITLLINGSISVIGPDFTVSNVYKIEVVSYDY